MAVGFVMTRLQGAALPGSREPPTRLQGAACPFSLSPSLSALSQKKSGGGMGAVNLRIAGVVVGRAYQVRDTGRAAVRRGFRRVALRLSLRQLRHGRAGFADCRRRAPRSDDRRQRRAVFTTTVAKERKPMTEQLSALI
jgi:hypothetical protein